MPKYYELSCFEMDYSSFLKDRLSGGTKKYGSYIDPDCVGDVRKTDFYNDLTVFLNGREKELKDEYSFLPPLRASQTQKWLEENENKNRKEWMDDYKISVVKNGEKLFCLTSDQFGFSAAESIFENGKDERYPLVKLLYSSKGESNAEQKKIINRITKYVNNTRTIGGSFLWPVCPQGNKKRACSYNLSRGVDSYLEDRVDLTLLEIKHVINGRNNNNFEKCKSDIWLYDEYEKDGQGQKVNTHMKQWFDHFDSFQEYVEYFMLEPFCQKVMAKENEKGYDYIPLNIIDREPVDEKKIDDYRKIYYKTKKKDRKGELQTLKKEGLIDMLKNLENMILERTAKMERAIESYREEQKISHTKQ